MYISKYETGTVSSLVINGSMLRRGSGKDMNNQLKRIFILALLTVMFIVMLNMNTLIFQVRETINLKSKIPKIWISMGKF